MAGEAEAESAAQASAFALARQWAALPEPAMRTAAVVRFLSQVGDARAVTTLEWLIRGVRRGDRACVTVYNGIFDPDALLHAVGHPRLAALFEEASRTKHGLATLWLFGALASPAEELGNPQDLVHRDLQQLTLGGRRALARRSRGEALNRLISDPDPGVIKNVLNNPQTTEQTVLAICARRPTVAAPLACVLRHERWNTRYRVRLALVRNPYLPVRLGINVLVFLRGTDLRSVHRDAVLAEDLRLAAERLLRVDGDGDTVDDGS